MADEPQPDYTPIQDALKEGGIEVEPQAGPAQPLYQKIGDTRIPVSKSLGKVWKSRRDQAKRKMRTSGMMDAWDECIRYYNNDQSTGHKGTGRNPNMSRVSQKGVQESDEHIETENIVFANTTALVPATYAKNPEISVTAQDKGDEKQVAFAKVAEKLITALFQKEVAPGINLKPKARKAVINTCLTNLSYIEIGYTEKDQGSEVALQQLGLLSDELEKAKDTKEIQEIEGKIMAMEEKVDVLRPSGPWVKFRRPHDVLRDPAGTLSDLSDHNWVMIRDFVQTDYLRAVYYQKKDENSTEYESIFAPTHILSAKDGESGSVHEEVKNFSLIPDGDDAEHSAYGYENKDTYKKAQYTEVWYVWDKVTRRCFLFNDKDWTWPIWVWDDPTKIQRFFPLRSLEFYTDPENDVARSEVMYYLDQQDAINEIHSERRRAISWARKNIFYNVRQIKDGSLIDSYLSGGTQGAVGVDLPEGQKLTDHIYSVPPPSAQFMQLFDTKPFMEAIDRVSSVTSVMRSAEFKTNTTNKAIANYQSQTQTRLDEKIDQIEDFIGGIGCDVLEMCVQKMSAEQVKELLGDKEAQIWSQLTPMSSEELRKNYSITIVGGSALKPTSQTKKEQAIQVGQILGQFGKGVPAAVMIALKVMERAFDDVVITDDDWEMLIQSVQQQMQQGQEGDPQQIIAQLEQQIDAMPPQAKQALGSAMAKGVPIRVAIEQIMQKIAPQGAGNPQAPQGNQGAPNGQS